MYEIDWSPRARRQLAKVRPRGLQLRLVDAVGRLSAFPSVPGLERLVDHRFGFRLRVGAWRVLLDVETERHLVLVQEVRKRDERTY